MTTPTMVRALLEKEMRGRKATEEILNARPHFVPLDLDILTETIGHKLDPKKMTVAQFRAAVIEYVTSRHKFKIFTRNGRLYTGTGEEVTGNNIRKVTPAVVYSGNNILGVMYAASNSFSSIYKSLFQDFLNKELYKNLKVNRTNYRKGFDIGHTIVDTGEGLIAETPLSFQLDQTRNLASLLKDSDNLDEEQRKIISDTVMRLNTVVGNFEIHASYGSTINTTLSKSFKKGLLSVGANIVIIQDRRENQGEFAKVEQSIKSIISKILAEVHFSRSLKEEVGAQVLAAMAGKPIKATSKSVKLKPIEITSKKVPVTKEKVTAPKVQNIRTNRAISLTTLLSLLNKHLHDVVAANMGDGNSRNVLNYRTGRFATSTKVERLSQSREGAITAYYSYMKNPYATFSEGGRQQVPRSRDPKLLISKSIREIAAHYISNQLRAVNV